MVVVNVIDELMIWNVYCTLLMILQIWLELHKLEECRLLGYGAVWLL
jgi:hypothetical protein